MSFVTEVYQFILTHKKYWLISMIVVMLLFGGLIVLAFGLGVADPPPLDLISAPVDSRCSPSGRSRHDGARPHALEASVFAGNAPPEAG
jgi:hypothetical protein